ncbi:hypothetical protein, partial [Acetobacter peroxydans]|uniref:hypothetical protein n=2 Tax=Acetobacter peroxydans TaxID=104098 RepID=UPI002353D352
MLRFGLVGKIVLVTCLFLIIFAVSIIVEITHLVRSEMQQSLQDRLHASMCTAVSILERDMPTVHVMWGVNGAAQRVTADSLASHYTDHRMTDAIARAAGGRAVLFVADENRWGGWLPLTASIVPKVRTLLLCPSGRGATQYDD